MTRSHSSSLPPCRILSGPMVVLAAAGLLVGAGDAAAGAMRSIEGAPVVRVLAQAEQPQAAKEPFQELNEALAAARAKLEELTGAAEIATVASDLRRELETARAENERLSEELEQLRVDLRESRSSLGDTQAALEEKERARAALQAKEEALNEAAERASSEISRLQAQLNTKDEELRAARVARAQAESQQKETQEILDSALEEAARLGQALTSTQEVVARTKADLSRAEDERATVQKDVETARGTITDLQQQLESSEARLRTMTTQNAKLEQQVATFRDAAGAATEAARENLLAVESKIQLLQTALAEAFPNGELPAPADAQQGGDDGAQGPDLRGGDRQLASLENGSVQADGKQQAIAAEPDKPVSLMASLPFEKRVQAESLLDDLKAEKNDRGLVMTVPGEDLFAHNSERIDASAHDTLAKVAELIGIFDGREVQIIGHTDAMGEAVYNKALSERRAGLIKDFFVDTFEIDAARLDTVGLGEEQPIASNATIGGRQANRRIEVLILD